jgi:Glycosyltransferase family 87
VRRVADPPPDRAPRIRSGRPDGPRGPVVIGLLVFVGGLAALAALVPVGHGFAPKGGGWFIPAVVGGVFTLHPLLIAVPWAACFACGLVDWRDPWRVEHLDLLALAGFFPVAMLLSDDAAQAGLWLAAACLCWLFCRLLGVVLGRWPMPELRPSVSAERLGRAIVVLLLIRLASLAGGNILDVGQASSIGAWRLLHGLHLYGAVSWQGPGRLLIYRPDTYGPFAYYAYLPFAALFPVAPAVVATLLPAVCFDALTLAGLHKLGWRLGGRALARAFVFAYLLFPFPDLSLTAETNDALIAALCVWTIVVTTERPAVRGLLMAAATLTKFIPVLLAVQFLGVRKGRWRYALSLLVSLAAMLAWPVITSGPARFLDSTVGYQLVQRGGGAQFSIWTYLPHAALVARPLLAAALVLLALSPLVRPPVDDPREQAALAAALLIGAQLLLGYWFYSYLTWCYPLLIIALVKAPPDQEAASPGVEHQQDRAVLGFQALVDVRLSGVVVNGVAGGEVGGVGRRSCPNRATGDDEALSHAR